MKIYYSILIAFGITFLSCQTNDDFGEVASPSQNKSQIRFEDNDSSNPDLPFVDLILENNMEWVSYLLAETLIFSPESRDYFTEITENSFGYNSVIKLNMLFQQDQDNEAFRAAFEDRFWCFEEQGINCGTNGGRPQGRVNPGGHSPTICLDAYCEFLDYILNKNCIEIYIPNGLSFYLVDQQVASTAHPLNQNLYNEVYIHNSGFVQYGIVSNNGIDILSDNVDINYFELNELQNLLVARPYRNESNCTYDLLVNNFTTFLSY